MDPILTQTVEILKQSAELMKVPAVSSAMTGLIKWLKNLFKNNKRAQERLEMIEKLQANEETIKQLQINLDDLLYENQELKKQLEEKIKEIQEKISASGININKTNTINITGDGNIAIPDVNNSNINININKKDN